MIEFVPYILFVFGFNPETNEHVKMREKLIRSEELCISVGEKSTGLLNDAAKKHSGTIYDFKCIKMPDADEIKDVYEMHKQRPR